MARKNPFRPFVADPEMQALRPDVTGNSINGLGEAEPRRPGMVFWAPDPDDIPFGEVQKWFYRREPPNETLMRERAKRKAILDAPLPPLSETTAQRTPEEWTAALDAFIDAGDCERVGVAGMRPEWVYRAS